jgi:hypothetical protein
MRLVLLLAFLVSPSFQLNTRQYRVVDCAGRDAGRTAMVDLDITFNVGDWAVQTILAGRVVGLATYTTSADALKAKLRNETFDNTWSRYTRTLSE